jgi:hypothetical protein
MQKLVRGWLTRAEIGRMRPAPGIPLSTVVCLRVAFGKLNELLVFPRGTNQPIDAVMLDKLIGKSRPKNAKQRRARKKLGSHHHGGRIAYVHNNFYIIGGCMGLGRASLRRCIGPNLARFYLGVDRSILETDADGAHDSGSSGCEMYDEPDDTDSTAGSSRLRSLVGR